MAKRTPTVDLNLLPIAFALFDEGSVSRAARVLGVSQSAVSMALRKMRQAFDDPLFIRVPSGVAPTPRAHAIIEAARPLLTQLHEDLLKGQPFDPATARRLHDFIYSAGNRRDPAEAYKAFRGRMPSVDALLRKRGLIENEAA